MSQPLFFYDSLADIAFTTTYRYIPFGFVTRHNIIISPEPNNTDDIYFSFDGINIMGRLESGDAALNMNNKRDRGIYIKSKSGNQNARVWGF